VDFNHRLHDKCLTERTLLQFELAIQMMLFQLFRRAFAATSLVSAGDFLVVAKFVHVFFVGLVRNWLAAIIYAVDIYSFKFASEGSVDLPQRFKGRPTPIHTLVEVAHDALIAD